MKYYSLNNQNHWVNFQEALKNGLAPDKGLYFPDNFKTLPQTFFDGIENLSDSEIAFQVIHQFVGNEIPEKELKQIITETLCFEFPIIPITESTFFIELFHGPTMAFKDVGARFMSRCLAYFNKNKEQKNIVLVATSGDTGGAVANGFLDVKGVEVVILYPSGKVSDIQERQLTTLGKNITAYKVEGVFDDCQDMVKQAFLDIDFKDKNLTSANSINVARWLPQMFYFFIAYKNLKKYNKSIVVSCPSGNFGNVCAGILSKKLGLPIKHFVAATNSNDTVSQFLKNGIFSPKPSISTISNAMDVGNPSNFVRILKLYNDDLSKLKQEFSSYSFSDFETETELKRIFKETNYVAEPHGVVGYLGLKKELQNYPDAIGLVLETAHPVKFLETVESLLSVTIEIPNQIKEVMNKSKKSIKINNYSEFKNQLLNIC